MYPRRRRAGEHYMHIVLSCSLNSFGSAQYPRTDAHFFEDPIDRQATTPPPVLVNTGHPDHGRLRYIHPAELSRPLVQTIGQAFP